MSSGKSSRNSKDPKEIHFLSNQTVKADILKDNDPAKINVDFPQGMKYCDVFCFISFSDTPPPGKRRDDYTVSLSSSRKMKRRRKRKPRK